MNDQQQAAFSGWARVEVMVHQTHIGFVRTEAYGQAVMFRIDTPGVPEREYVLDSPAYVDVSGDGGERWCSKGTKVRRAAREGLSVLVGAGSIYRIIPCTEAAALAAIESDVRPHLKLVALPEGMALPSPDESLADGDDDDGEDFQGYEVPEDC